MKTVYIFFAMIVSLAAREPTSDDDRIFQLVSASTDSSLDVSLLKKIASSSGEDMGELIEKLFKPAKGHSRVYYFRSAFWGKAKFKDEPQIFHDSLVLLVNSKGLVLDGFSYTEEWAEMPLFCDLYRISAKNLPLKSLKRVSQLKLKPAIQNFGDVASSSKGFIDLSGWSIASTTTKDANKSE